VLLVALGATQLDADTIFLKNGSILEGTIIAESERAVVMRLPSGNVTFPRRQIREVRYTRGAPPQGAPAALLSPRRGEGFGSSPSAPAASASQELLSREVVYLRDGRRVPGKIAARDGHRVSIDGAFGKVSYPEWMIDRNQELSELWRFTRELSDPLDPVLLRELAERKKRIESRLRGLDPALRELREEKAVALEKMQSAGDVPALRALAVDLESLQWQFPPHHRNRIRDLGIGALRAVADAMRRDSSSSPLELFETYAAMHRLKFSPEHRETARFEMKNAADAFFRGDPAAWMPGLQLLDRVEGYDWWKDLGVSSSDMQRWDFRNTDWSDNHPLPEKVRVVFRDGRESIVAVAPAASELIESVWVPSLHQPGTDTTASPARQDRDRTPCWYRVFWCPVERQWKRTTVPEVLVSSMSGVLRHLGEHVYQERVEASSAAYRLLEYNSILDALARSYDARKQELRLGHEHEHELERANQALAKLLELNERSLRRRAHLAPAFVRLRHLEALFEKALAGEKVDLEGARPPKSVTEIGATTPETAAEQLIIASLRGWDPAAKLQTLRSSAVRRFAKSPAVAMVLQEIASDGFALPEQRRAAEALLQGEGIGAPGATSARK
jgi:hypothetical protein